MVCPVSRLRDKWDRVEQQLKPGFSLEPEPVDADVLLAVGDENAAAGAGGDARGAGEAAAAAPAAGAAAAGESAEGAPCVLLVSLHTRTALTGRLLV